MTAELTSVFLRRFQKMDDDGGMQWWEQLGQWEEFDEGELK